MNDGVMLGGLKTTREEINGAPDIESADLALFSYMLGTQIRCGVPILDSLERTYLGASNARMRECTAKAYAQIKEGEALASALNDYPGIPKLFTAELDIGEECGNLDVQCLSLAAYYARLAGYPVDVLRRTPESVRWLTSALATMIGAGLPVLRALRIAEGDCPFPVMKTHIHTLITEIEAGGTLSEAMAKLPGVFDSFYVGMIRAGEAGGAVELILARLDKPFAA